MGVAMGCPQQLPQQIPQQILQQVPQQIPQQFATPQPMGAPLIAPMSQMAAQQFPMYPPPGGGQVHVPVTPMPLQPTMTMQQRSQMMPEQQSQMMQPPKPRVPVTTAHIPIFKMPKKHGVAIIEHIEPRLDTTIVGPLDQSSVSMVLWLLTALSATPSSKISM